MTELNRAKLTAQQIQIQHLLKLNPQKATSQTKIVSNSNTTLVKVKLKKDHL